MGHGVQAHHIGCAERSRAGASQLFTSQVIHHVIAQAKIFSFFDGGQHAGNTDPVSNEVRRVVRTNHVFTQATGYKGFQVIQHLGPSGWCVDQFHQRHIARRVKKVNPAETGFYGFRQGFAKLRNRQARGIACHDGAFSNERCYLLIKRCFPVHAFGNGFNDQVALCKHVQVLFVVGLLNQHSVFRHA